MSNNKRPSSSPPPEQSAPRPPHLSGAKPTLASVTEARVDFSRWRIVGSVASSRRSLQQDHSSSQWAARTPQVRLSLLLSRRSIQLIYKLFEGHRGIAIAMRISTCDVRGRLLLLGTQWHTVIIRDCRIKCTHRHQAPCHGHRHTQNPLAIDLIRRACCEVLRQWTQCRTSYWYKNCTHKVMGSIQLLLNKI